MFMVPYTGELTEGEARKEGVITALHDGLRVCVINVRGYLLIELLLAQSCSQPNLEYTGCTKTHVIFSARNE